jgi:hypothetical protein
MVHAAVGIAFEEFCDRRVCAERLKQFDLGVGQGDEDRGHTMLRLRHRSGNLGPQSVAVDRGGLADIGHRDGDVIELADHFSKSPSCTLSRRR